MIPDVLEARRAAAACDSAALWDWRKGGAGGWEKEICNELLNREGTAALNTAFAISDFKVRGRIAGMILNHLLERDRLAALAIYHKHRSDIALDLTAPLDDRFLAAAGAISAGEFIATREAIRRDEPVSADRIDCPEGFDYRKALDYLATDQGRMPDLAPQLLRNWGKAAPAEAAKWLLAHAPAGPGGGSSMDDAGSAVTATLAATAMSGQPGRMKAYDELMKLPEIVRNDAWENINGSSKATVDPGLLEAATVMGERSAYLGHILLNSRFTLEPDPNWAAVPATEREALLNAEEERWKATPALPLAVKIHSAWRRGCERNGTAPTGDLHGEMRQRR